MLDWTASCGEVFHERYVLVGGGVEDDLRPDLGHELVESRRLGDGGNDRDEAGVRGDCLEFLLEVVEVALMISAELRQELT